MTDRIPNAETIAAIEEAEQMRRGGVGPRFETIDELFADLASVEVGEVEVDDFWVGDPRDMLPQDLDFFGLLDDPLKDKP